MKSKDSSLSKRLNKSYETKDKGTSNKGIYNWKALDRDIQFYKPKEGKLYLNIIPFAVKSPNHPLVKSKEFQIGDMDYVMDLFVHRSIGPSETDVICLKKNYNKACPICEEAEKMRDEGKKKEYDELKSSRRVVYNIVDEKNREKGVQIFETSHNLFEKELIEEAKSDSEGKGMVNFADTEDGKIIECRAETDSFGGHEFFRYKSFRFRERTDALDEELLEKAVSFDELITVHSYEAVQKILYGEEESVNEEEDEKQDNQPTEKKVEKKAEEPKASSTPAKGKCPSGHVYGKDVDEFDECMKCKVYDECMAAK